MMDRDLIWLFVPLVIYAPIFILMFRNTKKKQTNADRIRSMTDTELADWLIMNGNGSDFKEWLEWLQKEADDDRT